MRSATAAQPTSERARPDRAEAAPVEVVMLAAGEGDDAIAAAGRIREHAAGRARVEVTVALLGASAPQARRLQDRDPSTRFVGVGPAGSAADAWGAVIRDHGTPWILLLTDDVRLDEDCVDRLLRHGQQQPGCTAVTPSIRSGSRVITTAAPEAGRGVCLMVSREALARGGIDEVDHAPDATAAIVRASSQTGSASGPPPEPDRPAPAPGGGAPPGEVVWIDNQVHAGAEPDDAARRVHLGCGKNHIPGWLNVDGDAAGSPDQVIDLRRGLPFADDSVDLVYSEHLFEHCSLEQGLALFAECLRVLVPGGVIRTAMPNLQDTVRYYLGDWKDQAWLRDFPQIDTPARMLNVSLRDWGHQYLYDHEELHLRLRQTGFVDIRSVEIGQSTRADLRNLETRAESTLIVEASKP